MNQEMKYEWVKAAIDVLIGEYDFHRDEAEDEAWEIADNCEDQSNGWNLATVESTIESWMFDN